MWEGRACNRIKSAAAAINAKKGQMDNMMMLDKILNKINPKDVGSLPHLIDPNRRVIATGPVMERLANGSFHLRTLLVFNDMVVCGAPHRDAMLDIKWKVETLMTSFRIVHHELPELEPELREDGEDGDEEKAAEGTTKSDGMGDASFVLGEMRPSEELPYLVEVPFELYPFQEVRVCSCVLQYCCLPCSAGAVHDQVLGARSHTASLGRESCRDQGAGDHTVRVGGVCSWEKGRERR